MILPIRHEMCPSRATPICPISVGDQLKSYVATTFCFEYLYYRVDYFVFLDVHIRHVCYLG